MPKGQARQGKKRNMRPPCAISWYVHSRARPGVNGLLELICFSVTQKGAFLTARV